MSETNGHHLPVPQGVLGDGALKAGRYNLALVRRAIRGGWNVPDRVKKLVVEQMESIVQGSDDPRNVIGASRVLLSADSIDQRTEANADTTEAMDNQTVATSAERMAFFAELGRILADDPEKKAAVSELIRKRVEQTRGKFGE